MLLDLQDVVDMTEQGLCAPENWPPKHSSKFVQEFKQEEVEPAESTTDGSTVNSPSPLKVIGTNTSHGISSSLTWLLINRLPCW